MRLSLALLAGLCLASVPVLADTADPPATSFVADDVVITASGAAPAVAPVPGVIVDDGTLVVGGIREAVGVITNLKVVGIGVAFVLILAIALKVLTKHGAFAKLLERTGKTWVRPLLSVATGAVTSLAAVLSTGIRDPVSIIAALVSGALLGFGASGGVDTARVVFFPDARTKEGVDGSDLIYVAETLEREVVNAGNKSVEAAARDVHAVRTLPIAKRVEALAGLLRKAKA